MAKSLADKFSDRIDDDEYLELVDIMEDASGNPAVEKLLEDNLAYLFRREIGPHLVDSVSVDEWELLRADEDPHRTTDTILGTYVVYFQDGSDYSGNFVADGVMVDKDTFSLNAVYPGGPDLKYFRA